MELTPDVVAGKSFSTSRDGYDTAEVDSFMIAVAAELRRLRRIAGESVDRAMPGAPAIAPVPQAAGAEAEIVGAALNDLDSLEQDLLGRVETRSSLAEASADGAALAARAQADADAVPNVPAAPIPTPVTQRVAPAAAMPEIGDDDHLDGVRSALDNVLDDVMSSIRPGSR